MSIHSMAGVTFWTVGKATIWCLEGVHCIASRKIEIESAGSMNSSSNHFQSHKLKNSCHDERKLTIFVHQKHVTSTKSDGLSRSTCIC